MSLDQSILVYPIPPSAQREIAGRFWGDGVQPENLGRYFQYYNDQCRIIFQSLKERLPLKTHTDIAEIAEDVNNGLSRSKVKQSLAVRYAAIGGLADATLDACVDLAVRLIFMVHIGSFRNMYTWRRSPVWGSGSIQEFMAKQFVATPLMDHDGIRLQRGFDVCNMVHIAGFNIELTADLSQHLQLCDGDRTVTIFHHASFLRTQRESSVFPPGFIDETLQTLALLFPQRKSNIKKWYNKQLTPGELDESVLICGPAHRRIERYKYWHDRLVDLKVEFDEARPSNLSQWWNDRREGTQWYTFWVAISFTLLFGLIQTVVSILQLYKAYYPSPQDTN